MRKYGQVVISLENPILPNEMIENTPSSLDGLDQETEHDLRITGCKLIQISGVLLRLPQVAMATGQVLFQRYYYSKSFVRFPMEYTAMACVVLASKIEEAPRRIRDVINVFHNMKQIRLGQTPVPMSLNDSYVNLKNQVIKGERRILKELGFCVHVKHPHKYIITVAEILGNSKNAQLIQAAWSYMNDSLHSNVFVRFPPETIACACIHLSARVLKVPLPTSPPWYMVFGVDTETIDNVCTTILELYTRIPLPQEELEEKVEMAKKILENDKIKTKSLAESKSLNLTSNELNQNSNESMTIDSSTNSPVKYSDAVSGGGSASKNLEVLSVINRIKQQQQLQKSLHTKTSPDLSSSVKLKSTINQIEVCSSADNSTSNTPIKLEKSPRSLVAVSSAKRSCSPTSPIRKDELNRDRYQSESYSSENFRSHESSKRYKNDHSNNYDDDNLKDSRSRREVDNTRRSRTPPRSYVSSTISINNDEHYSSSRNRRRSPSPRYGSERYSSSRYKSSHRNKDSNRSYDCYRSERQDRRYYDNRSRRDRYN
ncbi:hypothetical protein RDWZM_004996 [Blomia tropicalis]|uniref:Cyclin-like domain-containing protein n=1 Tax=Blomia tropicalis TaxID=40697 RepID=A0A9Q0M589_BLOTA|nr:hypothetical protein RDWZM_004996 [Blomia tropicalis]